MANETKKNEWVKSIHTLVQAVDYDYIQSCSISVVPEGLKKRNEDAYIPRKVSIGPKFRGKRDDLLLIEEVKLRCMLSLIHRGEGKAGDSLEECSKAVWELDEKVRASYVTSLKFEQDELAKIMLLDGCFLLELLISKGLDSQLPSRLIPPGPAAEVLKDEDVLSDLMLLENQIPILVLHELFETLFPNRLKKELRANQINKLALSVLGYSDLQLPCLEAPHILDLVHFFVTGTGERGMETTTLPDNGNRVIGIMETTTPPEKLKLKRCALSLQAAGVSIQVIEDEDKGVSCFGLMRNCFGGVLIMLGNFIIKTKQVNMAVREVKGLDFHFKFEKGKLEISQLHITETTKAKWRNVIVWEHHKKNGKSSSVSASTSQSLTSPIGKFTSSALIFDGLICCSVDVNFLKEKKIIVDHTKMSNWELKELFRTISFGVDPGILDSSYVKLIDDLNNYSEAFFIFRILRILWHFFKFCLERLIKFLSQNYNFVAALLALLSVVQTVYALLDYYLGN